jgi:hypothetical protein
VKLHSVMCTCPQLLESHVRVPSCRCQSYPEVSPLFQIRWKRIVIDEGHNSANVDSRMTSLAKSLSVERRWIVTGTPTTNLLGLSFGKSSEAPVQSDDFDEYASPSVSRSQSVTTSEAGDYDGSLVARRWTSFDREDLRKLSAMMIHFLAVPHFAAEPQVFDTHIIDALFGPTGPLPGAIRVLTQVMQMQMIRHRSVHSIVRIGSRLMFLKNRGCRDRSSAASNYSRGSPSRPRPLCCEVVQRLPGRNRY